MYVALLTLLILDFRISTFRYSTFRYLNFDIMTILRIFSENFVKNSRRFMEDFGRFPKVDPEDGVKISENFRKIAKKSLEKSRKKFGKFREKCRENFLVVKRCIPANRATSAF